MRTREDVEEISEKAFKEGGFETNEGLSIGTQTALMVELLLDIRDLLEKIALPIITNE